MPRTRVGVLFGGVSEEHEVSVRSATEVATHLDVDRYEPVWVGITKDGAWVLCDGPSEGWEAGRPAAISPDRRVRGLLAGSEVVPLDVVLPVLHGRLGEDGAVQGLLELAGIPYVGCDVQSSAVCMDKSLAYVVVAAAGIATPAFRVVQPGSAAALDGLRYPLFVKPARSGSSFGVTKVEQPGELAAALEEARAYDAKVLVEEAVVGREVGCAVLGNDAGLVTGALDEITLTDGFFRIHQEDDPGAGAENSSITVPADLALASREHVRAEAVRIYRALGCRGLARVDVFLTADGGVVLNEVNTFPGLTSYSRYPRMMAAVGMSLTEVLHRVLALALE